MIGRLLFKPAPRVLIVDPAIHSLGGHHFVAMERLSLELDELSVPYRSLGASSVDSRVRKALGVSRCFSESIYGRTDWTKAEFRRRAKAMARDLARCVRWHRPNLVILPTCDQVLALALALAVNKAWSSWRPNVLLWLLFPPDRPGALEEYREAFSALRSVIGDDRKMHICCETNRMALAFADAIGIAIETHPGPNAKVMPDLGRPAGANGPIVACIGHASAAKGYQLLPGAIVRVLEENPRIRFNIHGTINARDVGADESPFSQLSKLGSRVELNMKPLPTLEYQKFFQAADMMLLPYDPVTYRIRGSGIFNEATIAGKPIIVTAGCGFAEEAFAEGRAVAIDGLERDSIANAIHYAVDHFEALRQCAQLHASELRINTLGGLLKRSLPGESLRTD